MAFKEVSRVELTEVIRRWQAGVSLRGLSRATGMSRTTLRKYLQAATDAGVRRGGPPPTEAQLTALVRLNRAGPSTAVIPSEGVLRPWAARIEAWLRREQLQLTRIQELLAQQGCQVSYTSLRRSVAIASHWPFDQWGHFLPEQTTAAALLDRLLHHAAVVVTEGESFRLQEARTRGGEA